MGLEVGAVPLDQASLIDQASLSTGCFDRSALRLDLCSLRKKLHAQGVEAGLQGLDLLNAWTARSLLGKRHDHDDQHGNDGHGNG